MIYVIHEPRSGLCQIRSDASPASGSCTLLTAVPGSAEMLARLQAELVPYHCGGQWYDLEDFNPATLVTSLLKALSPQDSDLAFTHWWNARKQRETGGREMVFSPADFFPPPTPGLEWAHEQYFFSSRKDKVFHAPEGEDFGVHAPGFRSTRNR